MTNADRRRFDAQIALVTSPARADGDAPPVAPAAVPVPAVPRPAWRRAASVLLGLAKPVARPVLFRLRRYFTEPVRQEMLALHAQAHQESAGRLAQIERRIDAARDAVIDAVIATQEPARTEMRLIYTGLLDKIESTQVHLAEAARLNQEASAVLRGHVDSALAKGLEQVRATLVRDAGGMSARLDKQAGRLHSLIDAQAVHDQRQFDKQSLALQLATAQLARVENYAYASARRVALPCGDNDMLVKTEAGYIICASSDLSVLSTLVDSGDLERGTRLLIQSLLRPGDVFVDVGANIGMHTIAGGHAMAAQGTIIAFEPFEPTRRLLEKSIWINGLGPVTRIHGCAASDHAGSHPLFLGASSGHHSLFTHSDQGKVELGQVEVRTERLDDVVEPALHVTLLKIDAEGAELAVLAGAAATVKNNPDIALIVEFGPSHLRATGQDGAAWLAAFASFGLEYRAIDPVTGVLSRASLAELEKDESTNLFFARPGSAAWTNVKEAA